MQERRRFARIHLIHYLMIFDRETNRLLGNLVDVSPDGLLMIAENPLETATLKHLRMNFPEEILQHQSLEFEAEVIWCKVDINPDLFAIGLKLTEAQSEHQKLIQALVDEYRD